MASFSASVKPRPLSTIKWRTALRHCCQERFSRKILGKLIALEGEKETLWAKMAGFAQADNEVVLHPAAVDAYRKKVAELQATLTSDEQERREAMDIVRSLVSSIHVVPLEGRGQVELHVCGALAELLNLPSREPGEPPNAAMVVAEERYRQYRAATNFQC